jgi:hypothetical protein
MAGGLMQLVAYGAQDIYLTGNPQITLFKVVYRRHTNFSCETIELPIDTAKPSGRASVQMLRNADLASKCSLRVTVPDLTPSNSATFNGKVAWVRRLGHAMIKTVEVQIGGSAIDKHWGVWLDLWYELTHTDNQARGYAKMIGDVPELTTLASSVAGGYILQTPLQFWFNRNYGLALPLIALQYHEVRVNFEFERIENLVCYTRGTAQDASPRFNGLAFGSSGLLVDYIYLDSDERRRFAQVGHEYLMEQLQVQESNLQANSTNQSLTVNMNHPLKEYVLAHRCGMFNGTNGKLFLCYTNDDSKWESAVDTAAGLVVTNMLNNSGTGTVSVDINNGTVTTFGGVDFTFIFPNDTPATNLPCVAAPILLGLNSFNAASKISAATVEINFTTGVGYNSIVVTSVTHTLTLEDISCGITSAVVIDNGDADFVSVVQLNNYGVSLNGEGNMLVEGTVVLNGHERFAKRDGNWFNYVQPSAHTHTPADGVNVVLFCLHPEQHQPTGSMNASRIDSAKFNYKVADVLASSRGALFDLYSGTICYLFAPNYNIVRMMSGMGGTAYSN